jgi:hypothetical protein
MRRLLPILHSAFIIVALAAPANAFKCGSGAGASCACQGRVDCKDMRKSEMCKGDLTCGTGKCTCIAALTEDPDAGGEVQGHIKDVLGKKPVLNAR